MNAHSAASVLSLANKSMYSEVLKRLNSIVLEDPRFSKAPGGVTKHHQYESGLIIHVAEVMSNVLKMTNANASDELVTAVIWHDYMKVREYEIVEGEVKTLPYHNLIRHVAGSAMEFHAAAVACVPLATLEKIEHLLLSHHGRKEWGSPIVPATEEAYILHAADMMSATGCNL